MIVVRKKVKYVQQVEQQNTSIKQIKKKNKKAGLIIKAVFAVGIGSFLFISIILLLRFAAVTELRHEVHRMGRELAQLEAQKERFKIEIESASKSRRIENEAKERLGLQYPLPEQIVYINVNPEETAALFTEPEKTNEAAFNNDLGLNNSLYSMFDRLANLF